MAALAKVEALYQADLSDLIRNLTEFEDEDENFKICCKFAMSHFLFNNYLSANKWEINRKIDGIIEKLQFHGFPGRAEKLRILVKKFICLKEAYKYDQVDLEWQILQLLLCLAYRPSDTKEDISIDEEELKEPLDSKLLEKKKLEEWATFLREDDDKFNFVDDSKSDWSDLDSEEGETSFFSGKVAEDPASFVQLFYPPFLPKPEPVVKYASKKEFLKRKLQESMKAEDLLKTKIQHSWWNIDAEICKVGENPCLKFMDLITSFRRSKDNQLLMVLSERKILREVLWTLHCPSNEVLFRKDDSHSLVVRKNFTLPTATQKATCETVKRLTYLLHICRQMLDFRESLDFFSSSFTLQAYANTLAQLLEPFTNEILSLEKQLNEQDSCVTLLDLDVVSEKYFFDLEYIYQIHLKASWKCESQPNWLASARLLSELEIGLLEATSARQTNAILQLFIKSLRVFIDITDRWLSEGCLQDFRDEFLIFRSDEEGNTESPALGSFIVRRLGLESRILDGLAYSVLNAARSMEFAQNINETGAVYLNVSENGSMYEQFLSKFGAEISKDLEVRELDNCAKTQLGICELSKLPSEAGAKEELSLQWYKDLCRYHPLVFKNIESLLTESQRRLKNNVEPEISSYDKYVPQLESGIHLLPLNIRIESILDHLISLKHDPAALKLKQYLITNASLLTHLDILQKVFLLESGHTLMRFFTKMFTLVEADLWKNAESLSPILEDCIERDIGEFCEHFRVIPKENKPTEPVKKSKSITIAKALKNIDNIFILYQVEWPLSIVISEEALGCYNVVFRFLSKIVWAQWSLQALHVKDLKKTESDPKTQRLFHLRFFLLSTVSSIHNHFIRQISEDVLETLKKEIFDAPSLDTVLLAHKKYLKKLTNHCLSDDFTLKKGLFPYLSLCERFKSLWRKQIEGSLKEEKVVEFEKQFVTTHWLLTCTVETAVNITPCKYAAPLAELWKVLSSNIPTQCSSGSSSVFYNLANLDF